MSERRKTPDEKKALDYKKQRRTTWDSDKAARKAIPAAKARRHREERTFGKSAIRTAQKNADEEFEDATVAALKANAPLPSSQGHGLTLKEHVARQAKRRTLPRNAPTKRAAEYGPHSEQFYSRTYNRDRDFHPFVDAMRLRFKDSKKSTTFTRKFARQLRGYLEDGSAFFQGFFAENPSWKPRLLKWTERVLRNSADV